MNSLSGFGTYLRDVIDAFLVAAKILTFAFFRGVGGEDFQTVHDDMC